MAKDGQYASDRYITPGVIIAAIVVGGLVVAVVAAGVAYLTARGIDPDPMLKLVATIGAGLFSALNVVLTLAGRTTVAKVERNTGQLAAGVTTVASTIDSRLASVAPAADEPTTAAVFTPPAGYGLARTNGTTR